MYSKNLWNDVALSLKATSRKANHCQPFFEVWGAFILWQNQTNQVHSLEFAWRCCRRQITFQASLITICFFRSSSMATDVTFILVVLLIGDFWMLFLEQHSVIVGSRVQQPDMENLWKVLKQAISKIKLRCKHPRLAVIFKYHKIFFEKFSIFIISKVIQSSIMALHHQPGLTSQTGSAYNIFTSVSFGFSLSTVCQSTHPVRNKNAISIQW